MGHFGHGAGGGGGGRVESTAEAARNMRAGLVLFAVYLLMYGSFVVLHTFFPSVMAGPAGGLGVNVAVAYGMALIVAAFVLALVYAWVCRTSVGEPAGRAPAGEAAVKAAPPVAGTSTTADRSTSNAEGRR